MTEQEKVIIEAVLQIVQRKSPDVNDIDTANTLTGDLGLGSMDYAELVATLEMELDADPFAEKVSITSIRTVKDLIDAYASVS